MSKRIPFFVMAMVAVMALAALPALAETGMVEIEGMQFPKEKVIAGKTLYLNGVSYLKKFGLVKVYVVGLYLEKPTHDAETAITSQQCKYMLNQYLTDRATAKKLREGFIELMEENNPKEVFDANRQDVEKYASWFTVDMVPGMTTESLYVPGEGLHLIYKGKLVGTIPGDTFAQMYYRYSLGENAQKKLREGLLGL
jgi:hypothetical protein